MNFAPGFYVPSFLEWFEGIELYVGVAYLDHGGRWTYGMGHSNLRQPIVKEGDTITLEDARQLLKDDLAYVWRRLEPHLIPTLSDWQKNVCCSLAFNGGISGFLRSDVAAMINNTEKKYHLLYAVDLIKEYKVTAKDKHTGIRRRFVGLSANRRTDEAYFFKMDIPKQ